MVQVYYIAFRLLILHNREALHYLIWADGQKFQLCQYFTCVYVCVCAVGTWWPHFLLIIHQIIISPSQNCNSSVNKALLTGKCVLFNCIPKRYILAWIMHVAVFCWRDTMLWCYIFYLLHLFRQQHIPCHRFMWALNTWGVIYHHTIVS